MPNMFASQGLGLKSGLQQTVASMMSDPTSIVAPKTAPFLAVPLFAEEVIHSAMGPKPTATHPWIPPMQGPCGLPLYVNPVTANGVFTCAQICAMEGYMCNEPAQQRIDEDLTTCSCWAEEADEEFAIEAAVDSDLQPAGCTLQGDLLELNVRNNRPGCHNPGVENLSVMRLCACQQTKHGKMVEDS